MCERRAGYCATCSAVEQMKRGIMPEHFTKSTIEASYWCARHGKETRHRIDNGRRGPCLLCIAELGSGSQKSADEQFLLDERAAIIEYDGNTPRARAEQLAREQMIAGEQVVMSYGAVMGPEMIEPGLRSVWK